MNYPVFHVTLDTKKNAWGFDVLSWVGKCPLCGEFHSHCAGGNINTVNEYLGLRLARCGGWEGWWDGQNKLLYILQRADKEQDIEDIHARWIYRQTL